MTDRDRADRESTPTLRPPDSQRTTERAHEHLWRLRSVICEDGLTAEDFSCAECGDVTFR